MVVTRGVGTDRCGWTNDAWLQQCLVLCPRRPSYRKSRKHRLGVHNCVVSLSASYYLAFNLVVHLSGQVASSLHD